MVGFHNRGFCFGSIRVGTVVQPLQSVRPLAMLTVCIRIKVQVDLQVDKSSVVVLGPYFPQV
jgi:hypothetical protein